MQPHPDIILPPPPTLKRIPTQSHINLPPLNNLPPHSCTTLPAGSSALTSFYPPWLIYALTLTPFYLHPPYSLGSPAVTSFYTLWTTDPLAFTPFYHRWKPNAVQKDVRVLSCNFLKKFLPLQPHPYIILPPSEKNSHSILHHITPSEKTNPSFLHHFTPGSPALTSFYLLWTIYPLTLTTFYPPWQPSSYLILTPLNQLHPHYYTILTPHLAAQL